MRDVVEQFRGRSRLVFEDLTDETEDDDSADPFDFTFEGVEALDQLVIAAEGNPTAQAAIYAYFLLDAQLTFVKPRA